MSTKESYLMKKSWLQRRGGLFKKGHEVHQKFDACVAVLVLKDGELHVYQSHPNFPNPMPGVVSAGNLVTPEHFITVAQLDAQQRCEASFVSQLEVSDTPGFAEHPPKSRKRDFEGGLRQGLLELPETPGSVRSTPKPVRRDYFNFSDVDPEVLGT